jgi:hypothetical protein
LVTVFAASSSVALVGPHLKQKLVKLESEMQPFATMADAGVAGSADLAQRS